MRGMTLLVALILSGCASGQVAHAPAASAAASNQAPHVPPFIGKETIGDFRSWEHKVQSAYVLGFRSLTHELGVVCKQRKTIGETVTALTTRRDFTPDMSVHKALFILLKEDGCGPPPEKGLDRDMS